MRHFKYLQAASGVTLALALVGCGSTGSSGPSGSTGGPAAASKAVLSQYTQTPAEGTAQPDGTNTVTAAQEKTDGKANGLAGFGVATGGATSAVETTGTYVVGNVKKDGDDTLKIKVGNEEYTLSGGTSHETGQSGFPYMAYGNTAHSSDPGNNGAYLLNSRYASVAAFIKGGEWQDIGDEDDEWSISDMKGYGMIVTGLQTPTKNIPPQTAKYHGEYYYAGIDSDGNGNFGASGSFDMTADFNRHSLTGDARVIGGHGADDDPDHTHFDGTIEGNQFYGTTKDIAQPGTGIAGMNGTFAGGFYGPNAEEIAGVGTGTAKPENFGAPADISMSFIGTKK